MGAWFSSRHNPCCATNRQLAFFALASVRVFFLLLEFPTVPRAASRPAEPVTANCRHLNFALASPHRPEGVFVHGSGQGLNWSLEPSCRVPTDSVGGQRPQLVLCAVLCPATAGRPSQELAQ